MDKGVFETILIFQKKPQFLEDHLLRLQKGLSYLGYSYSINDLFAIINEHISTLHKKELIFNRFRIEFFIDAEQNVKNYCFVKKDDLILDNGINLALYYKTIATKKDENRYQLFKNKDRTVYNSAQKHAEMEGCFDSILVTPEKNISDTSRFNVFLIKKNTFFTSPLSDTPLDGVFRKNLIRFFRSNGYSFIETSIPVDQLHSFEEVFLTNVIRGIVPVKNIEHFPYSSNQTIALQKAFRKIYPAY